MLKTLLVLACTASVGLAHGGAFTPPEPWAGPGDTTGAGTPNGPPGPPPTTGGGNGPTAGPGAGGPSGPTGSGGSPQSPTDTPEPESWATWWEFNKAPYLQLRQAVFRDGPTLTGDAGFFTGRGSAKVLRDTLRPGPQRIAEELRPALLTLLEHEDNPDLVTAAMVALARIGESREGELAGERFVARLESPSQEVRETAALSLGILGEPRWVPLLESLLADAPAGRAAVDAPEVDPRTRTFAAYALGLIGANVEFVPLRREIVRRLAEALPDAREAARPGLSIGVLTAIGLIALPPTSADPAADTGSDPDADPGDSADPETPVWSSLEAQVALMVELIEDRRAHTLLRAHAPIAAARLLEDAAGPARLDPRLRPGLERAKRAVSEALLDRIDPRRKSDDLPELRQSAVQALGRIGDCDADPVDAQIRERLIELRSADRLTGRFALISLARIGARDGLGADPQVGLRQIQGRLLERFAGGRGGDEHWAALALGVLRRDRLDAGASVQGLQSVSRALEFALSKAKATEDIAAFAIACGIAGSSAARGPAIVHLRETAEPVARGYLCTALGMMNASEATSEIRAILEEAAYRPGLLRQASTALGLLGDKSVVPLLVANLETSSSLASQAAAASALGLIGDRRSIGPLVAMLADSDLTPLGRAFAAGALGLVADRSDLPWNTALAIDVNYRATVPTLNDADGKGLLNLL